MTIKRTVGIRKDLLILCEVSVETEEDEGVFIITVIIFTNY